MKQDLAFRSDKSVNGVGNEGRLFYIEKIGRLIVYFLNMCVYYSCIFKDVKRGAIFLFYLRDQVIQLRNV